MRLKLKYFLCLLPVIASIASGEEMINYKNISINSDTVTLDEISNELSLKGNLRINFGDFMITGENALLSYKKDELLINGKPASIVSEKRKINGKADRIVIYANLSVEMLGNAELFSDNRSIFSKKITYNINANE